VSEKLLSAIPVLPVRDLGKSVPFYQDRLGFTPAFEFGPYAGVMRGGIEIHLDAGVPETEPVTCRISAQGIEAVYEELRKQDVIHPDEPLETKPWGMRQFSVLDLDSNRITFAEPAADAVQTAPALKKFMITFTHIEGEREKIRQEDVPRLIQAHQDWDTEVKAQPNSSLVYLDDATKAKTVRMHSDGRLEVMDGPFTQGPEAAGGFYIIEAESIDHAVEAAKRHRWMVGANEVRELHPQIGSMMSALG
jgi:hypothetical protein